MSGNKFLVDTNIALYLFGGNKTVTKILDGADIYISFITELELLSFPGLSSKERQLIKKFLLECTVIDISPAIKEEVISLRQKKKAKLPDAIIAATSMTMEIPLLTADRDFKNIPGLVLVFFDAN